MLLQDLLQREHRVLKARPPLGWGEDASAVWHERFDRGARHARAATTDPTHEQLALDLNILPHRLDAHDRIRPEQRAKHVGLVEPCAPPHHLRGGCAAGCERALKCGDAAVVRVSEDDPAV